jgi:transposase
MNFVGIDVAKNSMEVTVDGGNESWNFSNDESGLVKLVKKMKKFLPFLIVLEATGGYESMVVASLQFKGFSLSGY